MQSIFFIRHGESEANVAKIIAGETDSPLTPHGIDQVRQAAQWAMQQGLVFDVIISSPIDRSRQTAQLIATGIDFPLDAIQQMKELEERHCGAFVGKSDQEYYQTPEHIAVKDFGVESIEQLYQRARTALTQIQRDYANKTVLLVSHTGIGKMLRIVIEGRDASEFDKSISLPNASIIKLL